VPYVIAYLMDGRIDKTFRNQSVLKLCLMTFYGWWQKYKVSGTLGLASVRTKTSVHLLGINMEEKQPDWIETIDLANHLYMKEHGILCSNVKKYTGDSAFMVFETYLKHQYYYPEDIKSVINSPLFKYYLVIEENGVKVGVAVWDSSMVFEFLELTIIMILLLLIMNLQTITRMDFGSCLDISYQNQITVKINYYFKN
jgi:hypothetical protein